MDIKKSTDITCLGVLLVDFFPLEIGRTYSEISAFRPVPGGAPANLAVAAARLGAKTAFIGKVGADPFGKWLADIIAKEGVDIRGMRFDPHVRTTINFIAQPDVNSYICFFYRNPGADTCLERSELDEELIRDSKAFHFDSLALTDEPSRSAAQSAAQSARQAGALVSFDVNYRPTLWKNPAEALAAIRPVLGMVDLLKMNLEELELLTGEKSLSSAQCILEQGPGLCIVTLGEQGSYFAIPGGSRLVPAYTVNTVDATGCGDAFLAGLLYRLVQEEPRRSKWSADFLREALQFANAVGALTSLTQGVIPALPFKAQVDEFIRNHP